MKTKQRPVELSSEDGRKTASFLINIAEELAWHTGATFTGMTIKTQEKGILIVLRAVVDGKHQVAFFGSRSLLRTVEDMRWFIGGDKVEWKEDKYAK